MTFPTHAYADEKPLAGNGWKMEDNGGVTSSGETEYTLAISTQAGMDEYVDQSIGSYPGAHVVTHIVIGKDVEKIPDFAFQCYYIKRILDVTFEEGSQLKEIGGSAFNGASKCAITSLPEGLQSIGYAAFSGTKFNAKIPSTVASMNSSFIDCDELVEVTIPAAIKRVGGFSKCDNLTTVHLQSTNTEIDSYAFQNCPKLKNINLDGVSSSFGTSAFQNCTSLEAVVINENLEWLSNTVFDGCTSLSSITFMGDAVPSEQFESTAFQNIAATGTVSIPSCASVQHFTDEMMSFMPEGWTLTPREHAFGGWQVAKPATCIATGEETRTCACGEKTETRVIPINKDAHAWEDAYTIDVAPTCTEPGSESIHCSRCDATKDARDIDALGHDFAVYTFNGDATCTADGTETASCTRCDATDTRMAEGTALGHDYVATVTEPTCTEGGFTTHTCSRCDGVYTDEETFALGHAWGSWEVASAPTCTEAGEKRRVCSRCDATEREVVAALDHDYAAQMTDPTCTEEGFTTHTCSRCGERYIDGKTPALGHDWSAWKVVSEPTCTEAGKRERACARCKKVETEGVDALGHNAVPVEAIAPTCTKEGVEQHWRCERCDALFADEGCEHSLRENDVVVPALGHDYVETVTEPTCTEDGFTTHTCSRCDTSYVDDEVEALGHAFEQGICTRCGAKDGSYVAPAPENPSTGAASTPEGHQTLPQTGDPTALLTAGTALTGVAALGSAWAARRRNRR